MKLLPLLLLALTGCAIPNGRVVSVTQSVLGFSVGENPSTQLPEVKFGFIRTTYQVVPVSTNGAAPKVNSSISIQQKMFSTQILEDFDTGGAEPPAMPTLARLAVMARSTNGFSVTNVVASPEIQGK